MIVKLQQRGLCNVKRLFVISYVALAGCATTPDIPTRVQTVTVMVPTPVACVKASEVPKLPGKVGDQLNGDAVHDLHVVSPALIRMRAVADKAVALLTGCVG